MVTTLDSAINSFPDSGGSLTKALAIHMDPDLISAMTQSIADVNVRLGFLRMCFNIIALLFKNTADALIDPDVPTILESFNDILITFNDIQSTIINALNAIVDQKPTFQGLIGEVALVKQTIEGALQCS
ncbi:hypothetical protein JB92DRAFT_3108261 [Gautieria morchelliformis]|nr:hypothetical protein JB92DRAFT_3108261 [Gautieria morchelliformis]